MRTSQRSQKRARARRPLIMLLSGVAVLLQVLLLFGLPGGGPNRISSPGQASITGAVPTHPSETSQGMPSSHNNPCPTLTVPPPPGVPIPEGAVLLYLQSPALAGPGASPGNAGQAPSTDLPTRLNRPLTPQDLLLGTLELQSNKELELTPDQARRLAEVVQELETSYRDLGGARDELLEVLTIEQKAWLEENPPKPGELPTGAPEETALDPGQRALEALGDPE
jgi:hypothetical protein